MKKIIICLLVFILFFNIVCLDGKIIKAAISESNIELGIREDVDEDGEVSILDLSIVAKSYNNKTNDSQYNSKYDINTDGMIDVYDLVRISKKLGIITIKIGYVYNTSSTGLNVRSGPGTIYTQIGKLYNEDKIYIVDESNENWYKIKFNNGYAYVHKDYITSNEPNNNYGHSLDYYVDLQSQRLNLTDKGGSWRDATTDEIKYYMNPENFLDNNGKYMFMKLNYISGISVDIINSALSGKGVLDGKGQAFLDGGKKYDINPIYLMCHSRLETGNGTSELANGVLVSTVDGKVVEPKIVYNMFGIGAEDSDPVRLGAERAYKEGWFTPEVAIVEGAKWIGYGYINNTQFKQNTLYEMRWNISHLGIGWHQYASDIGWAYKQAIMMASYLDQCRGAEFEFDIPTFTPTLREVRYTRKVKQ